MLNHLLEVFKGKTVYINGIEATETDISDLNERMQNGNEFIVEISATEAQNIEIITA